MKDKSDANAAKKKPIKRRAGKRRSSLEVYKPPPETLDTPPPAQRPRRSLSLNSKAIAIAKSIKTTKTTTASSQSTPKRKASAASETKDGKKTAAKV